MVELDGTDATTSQKPFRFWLNDNNDVYDAGDPDNGGQSEYLEAHPGAPGYHVDSSTRKINNLRDLEDFAPLDITWSSAFSGFGYSASLSLSSNNAKMEVAIFSVGSALEKSYLNDDVDAQTLVGKLATNDLSAGQSMSIDPQYLNDEGFLFEGIGAGTGTLTVTFFHNGDMVGRDSVTLQLQSVQQMYETYSVANAAAIDHGSELKAADISSQYDRIQSPSFSYQSWSPETNDYVLLVHGWRMKTWEKAYFANTGYKRLFWQGYKGRFGIFDWPTNWIDTSGAGVGLAQQIADNFAESEDKAWHSAAALEHLLTDLSQKYKNADGTSRVNVLSHSMGAYVVSEALEQRAAAQPGGTPIVATYVASQAATFAESYDGSGEKVLRDDYVTIQQDLNRPYFSDLGSAAAHLANFYNPVDYAMDREGTGLLLTPFGGYSEFLDDFPKAHFQDAQHRELDPWSDRYEILSFLPCPTTPPIGAAANVGGPFDQSLQVDLQSTCGFTNAPFDHSAQFESTVAARSTYWSKLLKTLRLQ